MPWKLASIIRQREEFVALSPRDCGDWNYLGAMTSTCAGVWDEALTAT